MDEGNAEKIDEQFSLLDARARKQRRSSIIMTVALVTVTGLLVLQLARDIVAKQSQVRQAEESKGELDKQLRTEQQKLNAAARAREKLEAEVRQLEATKKSYQDRILAEKGAHNDNGHGTGDPTTGGGETPDIKEPTGGGRHDPSQVDDPTGETAAPSRPLAPLAPPEQAMIIEESGRAPAGFYIKPGVKVEPGVGASGRTIFKVQMTVDVPEAERVNVERVTYLLSPKYYLKNMIEAATESPFEAKFNVFACESTILVRVRLRDGSSLAFDYDWCRQEGWPVHTKEPVIVLPEDEKTPSLPRDTNIATPSPGKAPTRPRTDVPRIP